LNEVVKELVKSPTLKDDADNLLLMIAACHSKQLRDPLLTCERQKSVQRVADQTN
jgi:hypothetical protein